MSSEVPAVSAAIRILERLAAELPRTVSPTVLVNELQLNRSTCYNILATLQRAGWVNKLDARGGWTLGPGLLALTGVSDDSIITVVREEIEALSPRSATSSSRRNRTGRAATSSSRSRSPTGVRVVVGVGDRFPFSAPALMQAVYAFRPFVDFLDAARRGGLKKFTEHTVVDIDRLQGIFGEVRERGYSTSIREFNLAQSAAAAPVFDGAGKPQLALGVLAFSSELEHDNIAPVGEMMYAAAARITARTGGAYPVDAVAAR